MSSKPVDKQEGRGADLEDKPTEMWAPVARRLFSDQMQTANEAVPQPDDAVIDAEEHDTEIMDQAMADTVEMSPEEAARAIAEAQAALGESPSGGQAAANELELPQEPAEAGPGGGLEAPTSAGGEVEAPTSVGCEVDTLEIPARDVALAMADVDLTDSVEVSGEEGEAARKLAEIEMRRRRYDPSATLVVEAPRMPKLSHECRMCGRKVSRPEPRRLRGSAHSEIGFRCEKCNNVFCAAHVVRVSGLWQSLVSGARFRCQLCVPGATDP